MLASTSKHILRTVVPSRSLAAFSTSSIRGKRTTVVVELLADIEGLGNRYERVSVSDGRMRNELAPYRLARWIPWKAGRDQVWQSARRTPRAGPTDTPLIAETGTSHPPTSDPLSTSPPTPSSQALLNALHLLPPTLTFSLRTTSPTSRALHGSLTLSDVQEKLAKDFGLMGNDVEVEWVGREGGERMKEVGEWEAVVRLRAGGKEQVTVVVVVVPV